MAEPPLQDSERRATSKNISALKALWPFVRPYRGLVFGAIAALLTTAIISLVLPLAVSRVVDGFETSAIELLDSYFVAALIISLFLAIGTAGRRAWPFVLYVSQARRAWVADCAPDHRSDCRPGAAVAHA